MSKSKSIKRRTKSETKHMCSKYVQYLMLPMSYHFRCSSLCKKIYKRKVKRRIMSQVGNGVFIFVCVASVFHFIFGEGLFSAIFGSLVAPKNNVKHTNDTQVCHKPSVFTVYGTTTQNYESTSM